MTLRFEIFPDDLDATVDFYLGVLRFRLIADRRDEPSPYVSLQRGSVRVGAARRAVVPDARAARRPPAGVLPGSRPGRVLPADHGPGTR
jgi:hypothetical protein